MRILGTIAVATAIGCSQPDNGQAPLEASAKEVGQVQVATGLPKVGKSVPYGDGGLPWIDTHNLVDPTYGSALIFPITTETTEYLVASDFGLKLPPDADVVGIVAGVYHWDSGFGTEIHPIDAGVRLFAGDTPISDNRARGESLPNPGLVTYGDPMDLWGFGLGELKGWMINSPDAGVGFQAQGVRGGTSHDSIDIATIMLTVFYTP